MKEKIKGFTLIELIIVIAIIAILAAIAFVAVNPAKRLGDANDDKRWAAVTAIADAWEKSTTDNAGAFPGVATTAVVYEIGVGTFDANCLSNSDVAASASLDLTSLVTDGYLGSVPVDEAKLLGGDTGYYFELDVNNIIKVGSCTSYGASDIYVTR